MIPCVRKHVISIIKGDGIGPEVIEATEMVMGAVQQKFSLEFEKIYVEAGLETYKKYGTNLPESSLKLIRQSECLLKGPTTTLEESGSELGVPVKIRKIFDLYANLRPVRTLPRAKALHGNVDVLIVRENTEGMYSGIESEIAPGIGIGIRLSTEKGARRIFDLAFKKARDRRKMVALGHKANVLKVTDGIYKRVFEEVSKLYPDIRTSEEHIDALAMRVALSPQSYDVIVLENLYGDIISDLAAGIAGGLGLAPSANIGDKFAMFEPVHGSAPDIAGKKIANPIASILSFSMCLDWLGEREASKAVESSVIKTLEKGEMLTPDLGGNASTFDLAGAIAEEVLNL